jgi:phosphatidylserine/phosphatidylglycerophosphate/cardiolipin synthase-like enzyme
MKKEVLGPILAALLAGAFLGYFGASGSQASLTSQLQSQLAAAQAEKASLQAQLATLASDKQALQQQISQLNARIVELNATIAVLSRGEPSILAIRFSPRGGCAAQVTYWLGRANSSVHILIYSFTLDSIGDAVLAAHQRGIEVKVVFEKQQVSQYSEYFRLAAAGVQVRNDTNPDLMHHKVAIIDGYIVLIGSFNWSASAEDDNNENLLVIRSAELAVALEREFQRVWTTGR